MKLYYDPRGRCYHEAPGMDQVIPAHNTPPEILEWIETDARRRFEGMARIAAGERFEKAKRKMQVKDVSEVIPVSPLTRIFGVAPGFGVIRLGIEVAAAIWLLSSWVQRSDAQAAAMAEGQKAIIARIDKMDIEHKADMKDLSDRIAKVERYAVPTTRMRRAGWPGGNEN